MGDTGAAAAGRALPGIPGSVPLSSLATVALYHCLPRGVRSPRLVSRRAQPFVAFPVLIATDGPVLVSPGPRLGFGDEPIASYRG
jgi:hypothetical protein